MFTATGHLAMVFDAPAVVPDATSANGLRTEQQLNVSLKAAADEQEYQFTLPITDGTPSLQQLEEWQQAGQLVTVLASAVRAISFYHDTSKDKDGNPVKKYRRAGRRLEVGSVVVEADAFVGFSAYDIRPAGATDLAQEAQKAHGEYLKRQAQYRQRQVVKRKQQAEERVQQRLAQAEAEAKAQAAQGQGKKSA
jgi:uncharacterized protein YlxW (UPF0749 family)